MDGSHKKNDLGFNKIDENFKIFQECRDFVSG